MSDRRVVRGKEVRPAEERFWEKASPEPNTGCWLWTAAIMPNGYGTFNPGGKRGQMVLAHRFSYMASKGQIPEGMFVLHSCDVRWCVNPDHLSVGTHEDNMGDMVRRGRQAVQKTAEEHPKAKLTNAQAREIRNAVGSHATVAKAYGVSEFTVSRIRRGLRFRGV